jgi:Skp family chaperone for outer membrane proteins
MLPREKAMDKTFLAAGLALAALPAAAAAQGEPAAAPASTSCYVEVAKLIADPPTGIGDLGAAIRELDAKLRPQAEEINALKAEVARLEARQNEGQGGQAAGDSGSEEFGDEAPRAAAPPPVSDATAKRLQEATAELEAKQNQLKLDYAEQRRALVGPVETRVSARAQAFATERGCAELKMARTPDLAALTTAGSQNVTGEFVAWYLANPPA